ncbi:MAG: carbonic anhydrase [Rubrivivax sp.]|nr:carbonic anhydrase [Rubrivivax sp.]
MHTIDSLLANNRAFVRAQLAHDAAFFEHLAEGQHPDFLWIGCSDSRVSPNLLTGTGPGEMFVHRNIANLVVPTDMNLLAVLQYAVEVLQVNHVIVCGHHGCGGVKAALGGHSHGLVDHWLHAVRETEQFHHARLAALDDETRLRHLVELNVIEQVHNLGKTSIVQRAWAARRRPFIHGWVFDIGTGGIDPLTRMISNDEELLEACKFHRAGLGPAAAAPARPPQAQPAAQAGHASPAPRAGVAP